MKYLKTRPLILTLALLGPRRRRADGGILTASAAVLGRRHGYQQ